MSSKLPPSFTTLFWRVCRTSILLVFSLLLSSGLMAQSKEAAKLEKKGRKLLETEAFEEAKKVYQQLLKEDPNSVAYNYGAGLSYYNSPIEKEKALPYFESALKNSKQDTIPEILYYIGRSKHYKGDFDGAIVAYNSFKSYLSRNRGNALILLQDVNRYLVMCRHGKAFADNPKTGIQVENLGAAINSKFPDYAPVIKDDESVLLFTSRRTGSTGGEIYFDQKFFEDIYFTVFKAGEWSKASNLDPSNEVMNSTINTPFHEAAINYNGDETKLFIYRQNGIWRSDLGVEGWLPPVDMGDEINTKKFQETHVFISNDGRSMFVVSDRKEGLGGRDIFYTNRLPNGKWSDLKNLGPNINTAFDEDAPFISPDGSTLFFSSKGHNSVGGYDVFKSVWENGNWSKPENLGSPINTAGDEIYYITNARGSVGFYSSSRTGGFGDMDIFRISQECLSVNTAEIRGLVVSGDDKKPVAARIKVTDTETQQSYTFSSDPQTGKYLMRLPTRRTYDVAITSGESLINEGRFSVPRQCEYYHLYQEVQLLTIRDSANQPISQIARFNDAFFDIESVVKSNYQSSSFTGPSGKADRLLMDSLYSDYVDRLPNQVTQSDTATYHYMAYLSVLDLGERKQVDLAEYSEKDIAYQQLIDQANANLESGDLAKARLNYQAAGALKPEGDYAKMQVKSIDNLLAEREMAIEQRYADYVTAGDSAFIKAEYPKAKNEYLLALELRQDELYPKQKITEIDQLMVQMAEEGQTEQVNNQYRNYLALGDQAFDNKDYATARLNYQAAARLRPGVEYPNDRMVAIDGLVADLENQRQKEQEAIVFRQLVAEADEALKEKDFEKARTNYIAAAQIRPEDNYLNQQLAELDNQIAQAAVIASTTTTEASGEIADQVKPPGETPAEEAPKKITKSESSSTKEALAEATQPTVNKEKATDTPSNQATTEETPDPQPAVTEGPIVFKNLLFDFDKSFLKDASKAELDKLFDYLMANEEVVLRVAGHTDWIGTEEYNMSLGERRALAAVAYLKSKGLSESRISYVSFGETQPVASNTKPNGEDNPEGRLQNRRCELNINAPESAYNIVLKF